MRRTTITELIALLLTGVMAVGCSGGEGAGDDAATDTADRGRSPATSREPSPSATPPRTASPTTTPTEQPPPERQRVRLLGIDASHHQGAIDWRAVAEAGVSFAYLKATEGTSFTDPRFAANRAAALDHGIDVGGYHYFSLCTPGAAQAEHFVSVLGAVGTRNHLPPAVDLELAGSCSTPPPRDVLLAEVRAFLELVEQRTGREPVVYLYPEFEAEYGFARELADHRQWVRSLGVRPDRRFWVWQQSDSGTVAGIAGPVDLNVMWRRQLVSR